MPTLTPAYGRDYKSAAAVRSDFNKGKDFLLNDVTSRWNGKPCSIRDFKVGTEIKLRYKKLTMVTIIKVLSNAN